MYWPFFTSKEHGGGMTASARLLGAGVGLGQMYSPFSPSNEQIGGVGVGQMYSPLLTSNEHVGSTFAAGVASAIQVSDGLGEFEITMFERV
jgi:hypothetical protein